MLKNRPGPLAIWNLYEKHGELWRDREKPIREPIFQLSGNVEHGPTRLTPNTRQIRSARLWFTGFDIRETQVKRASFFFMATYEPFSWASFFFFFWIISSTHPTKRVTLSEKS